MSRHYPNLSFLNYICQSTKEISHCSTTGLPLRCRSPSRGISRASAIATTTPEIERTRLLRKIYETNGSLEVPRCNITEYAICFVDWVRVLPVAGVTSQSYFSRPEVRVSQPAVFLSWSPITGMLLASINKTA